MKFMLVLTLVLSSLTASATVGKNPKYCPNQEDHCSVRNGIFSKIHYAKGEGRNCAEAIDDSLDTFKKRFGDIDCGDAGVYPDYKTYCYKTNRGISVYAKCDPSSKSYSNNASSQRKGVLIKGIIFH